MIDENVFECKKYKLNDKIELHVVNIRDFNEQFKQYIDSHIVSICEGESGNDIDLVKNDIIDYLEDKSPDTTKGSISEFIIHLYLKYIGFKQDCLFLNLEERSIKKGFDGVYSLNDEKWLMESKSGSITSQNMTHQKKIKEAYNDLGDKVSGSSTSKNNPWKNAYNHAQLADVKASDSIIQSIKKLSNEFRKSIYHNISEFNTIPSSTIFLNGTWCYDDSNICNEIKELIPIFKSQKTTLICITKITIDLFITYLNEKREYCE